MSKLISFIKLEGSIGGVTFYKRNGEIIARNKNGVNGAKIKNDPGFARTRENNNEFALLVKSNKLLREAAYAMGANARDNKVVYRITSLMAKVKNMDTRSQRGERNVGMGIHSPGAIDLFKGFDFNIKSPLNKVLKTTPSVKNTNGELQIPMLVPAAHLASVPGATHVRFTGAWVKIDFARNLQEISFSRSMTLMLDFLPSTVSLVPEFSPGLQTGHSLYLLKVEFGQVVNGMYYPLVDEEYNSLGVVDVA